MINTVQVVKLLGFYIQGDIKWNSHVTEMQKKAAKRLVQLKSVQWPPEEVHYSDALSRSGLGTLQQKTELGNKLFDKVVENPLNVLHPLIPFNDGSSSDLRNSTSYCVKPCKTNSCRDTFINKCESIFDNL